MSLFSEYNHLGHPSRVLPQTLPWVLFLVQLSQLKPTLPWQPNRKYYRGPVFFFMSLFIATEGVVYYQLQDDSLLVWLGV